MKYLYAAIVLAIFAIVLGLAMPAFGQDTLQVDVTKLDANELRVYQQLKQKAAHSQLSLDTITPEKVDRYAQMGKGLGIAINEGLGAVTKNVEQFAQTSAGKWLMVLITWKVMGNDAVGLVRQAVQFAVGGTLLVFGVPFFIYIFRRNCVAYPLLKSKTKAGFLTIKKEYAGVNDPIHDDAGPWGYAVSFAFFVGICVAIMFIH